MDMIIKPPIAANEIVSLRLTNGETLIAKFVSKDSTALTVTRPVVANPIQNEQGYGIYYSPFCATVDEDQNYRIPLSAVLIEPMHPREELKASYIKMTTGLDIPLKA